MPSVAFAAGSPIPSVITLDGRADAITISWPEDVDNAGYVIWRSPDGTLARARVLGVVQGGDAKSYSDLTAVLGARYRYAVRAFTATQPATPPGEGDWTVAPVSLATSAASKNPHLGTRADLRTQSCVQCHSIMDAPADSDAFLVDLGVDGGTASELCLTCHTGSVGGGIQSVGLAFQTGRSGHSVDTSISAGNALDSCAVCHNVHADSHAQTGLRPTNVRLNGELISVDSSGSGWCLACHKDGSTVTELITPSYDTTSHYPVTGTFPGQSTYRSAVSNVHASIVPTGTYSVETSMTHSDISRPAGDCRYCHASHRSASFYDALLVVNDAATETYANHTESDVAPLCFTCHSDVRDAVVSAETSGSAGHTVQSEGGFYPVGTALPCFVCHNPHGSARGNKLNISDTLGQNLDPSSTDPQKQRQFCFTCHTTADGLGWNSVEETFTAVPSDATVVGLSRLSVSTVVLQSSALDFGVLQSAPLAAPSSLRLSGSEGHLPGYSGACSDCHGSTHAPSMGQGSEVSKSCYDCHGSLKSMDKASAQKTDTFHHVLGSSESTYTGGVFLSGYSAPSSPSFTKYCLTCHIDHITNPGELVLRTSAADATPASSDFGLCTSCHASQKPRSAVNQKGAFTRAASPTPITSVRAIDAGAFSASKHNYDVLTGTGNKGNCVKCHNGAEAVGGSTLANFSIHASVNQSLISRMGDESVSTAWNSIPAQYKLCFQCHAKKGEVAVATAIGKDFTGKDWFGAKDMGAARSVQYKIGTTVIGTQVFNDEAVFSDMFRTKLGAIDLDAAIPAAQWNTAGTSGHQAERTFSASSTLLKEAYSTSTTSVRCSDCHDVHTTSIASKTAGQEWPFTKKPLPPQVAGEPANIRARILSNGIASDGSRLITLNDFWYRENNPGATGTVEIFCFECHSETAMMNKSHAASVGLGTAADHKNGFLACVNCHVPAIHGSGMPKLLADMSTGVMPEHQVIKWYDPFTQVNNKATARIFSVDMANLELKQPRGCATSPESGCHASLPPGQSVTAEQTGGVWSNWVQSF